MTNQVSKYALVRYIKDSDRMEPENVGVILQDAGRIDIKFDPWYGSRKGVESSTFKEWKKFLIEEITGEQKTLFRPDRHTNDFWLYLRSLAENTVSITPPLTISNKDERDFDELIKSLYERLVSRVEDKNKESIRPNNPTAKFRQLRDANKLDKRGLNKGHPVKIGGKYLWTPHRLVSNGQILAIDKVEVNQVQERTFAEIGALRDAASHLSSINGQEVKWVVMIDPVTERIPGQDDAAFENLKNAMKAVEKRILDAKAERLSTPDEVSQFVEEDLEKHLEPLA